MKIYKHIFNIVFISGKETRRWLEINESYRRNSYISSAGGEVSTVQIS